jgi:hypothetical protein
MTNLDGPDLTPEVLAWQRARQPKLCQWCGNPVKDTPRGRNRTYCTDRCRRDAYQARFARPEE